LLHIELEIGTSVCKQGVLEAGGEINAHSGALLAIFTLKRLPMWDLSSTPLL
jgi:hypothetical protein